MTFIWRFRYEFNKHVYIFILPYSVLLLLFIYNLYEIRLNCALLPFRLEGHEVAFKRSASSPLGMKVVFTLSGDEGLDSAALRSR